MSARCVPRRPRLHSQAWGVSPWGSSTVPTERSANAFAFGARNRVRMISTPSLSKTSSKARLNLVSRSWIRKRIGLGRSESDQANWRACCAGQRPSGLAVQPARCTRRLPNSRKKSTYRRPSQSARVAYVYASVSLIKYCTEISRSYLREPARFVLAVTGGRNYLS